MSEVIVWMEMPTGCPHCPMADDDSRFCKAAKKYIPMLGKPSWCPIKGVLPDEHGRLIDADAYQYYGDLADEPTIVPSTRKGERR